MNQLNPPAWRSQISPARRPGRRLSKAHALLRRRNLLLAEPFRVTPERFVAVWARLKPRWLVPKL